MKDLVVRMNTFTRFTARLAVIVLFVAFLCVIPSVALAQTAPDLGTASDFAVLGGPAVTLTDSTVTGDVGSGLPFPASAVTLTNSTITGAVHEGDAVAVAAYLDFLDAYDTLAPGPNGPTGTLLTGTLAGVTLPPGTYYFAADATLTGTLTLDAGGHANAVWIFKIGTSGTGALAGTGFSVVMAHGGVASNVFWWVADAATLTDSSFQGTILSGAAITVTGGTFNGNALATAAVTLTGVAVTGVTVTGGSSGEDEPGHCDRDKDKPGHCDKDKDKPGCDDKDKDKLGHCDKDKDKPGCDDKDKDKSGHDDKDKGKPGRDN